jgi:hypothetical protein
MYDLTSRQNAVQEYRHPHAGTVADVSVRARGMMIAC